MICTPAFLRSCLRALRRGGCRWKSDRQFFFHCALGFSSGREEEKLENLCVLVVRPMCVDLGLVPWRFGGENGSLRISHSMQPRGSTTILPSPDNAPDVTVVRFLADVEAAANICYFVGQNQHDRPLFMTRKARPPRQSISPSSSSVSPCPAARSAHLPPLHGSFVCSAFCRKQAGKRRASSPWIHCTSYLGW